MSTGRGYCAIVRAIEFHPRPSWRKYAINRSCRGSVSSTGDAARPDDGIVGSGSGIAQREGLHHSTVNELLG
jgi:hypothetical protein